MFDILLAADVKLDLGASTERSWVSYHLEPCLDSILDLDAMDAHFNRTFRVTSTPQPLNWQTTTWLVDV